MHFPAIFQIFSKSFWSKKDETNLSEKIDALFEDNTSSNLNRSVHQRSLIVNAMQATKTILDDIMIPRTDIVALPITATLKEILSVVQHATFSRLPVYRGSLDHIIGVIHIKDLLTYWGSQKEFRLSDVMRKPLFASPAMHCLDLLLEMRMKGSHLALVVDEFGGVDGLVTIEDILEQIVGNITDEHDISDLPQLIDHHDGSFTLDARMPLEQFEEHFKLSLSEEETREIDTVGGLIYSLAGKIPKKNETIKGPNNLNFKILDADKRRITRLKVTLQDAGKK